MRVVWFTLLVAGSACGGRTLGDDFSEPMPEWRGGNGSGGAALGGRSSGGTAQGGRNGAGGAAPGGRPAIGGSGPGGRPGNGGAPGGGPSRGGAPNFGGTGPGGSPALGGGGNASGGNASGGNASGGNGAVCEKTCTTLSDKCGFSAFPTCRDECTGQLAGLDARCQAALRELLTCVDDTFSSQATCDSRALGLACARQLLASTVCR